MWGTWILISCILKNVPSTLDNSNLQGKSNTVRVIGSRLYFRWNMGNRKQSFYYPWLELVTTHWNKQHEYSQFLARHYCQANGGRFLINLQRRTFSTTHEERSRTAPAQQDRNLVLLLLLLVFFCLSVACINGIDFSKLSEWSQLPSVPFRSTSTMKDSGNLKGLYHFIC